jgi:hypothetical protein
MGVVGGEQANLVGGKRIASEQKTKGTQTICVGRTLKGAALEYATVSNIL